MKVILVMFPARCMTCEELIPEGEKANWEQDVGVWHPGCPPPKNLPFYIRSRDRSKGLQGTPLRAANGG